MTIPNESNSGTPMTPDEQYLWDGSGAGATSTKRIEGSLRGLRFARPFEADVKVEARAAIEAGRVSVAQQGRGSGKWFALAAGLLMAGAVGYLVASRRPVAPGPAVTPTRATETWAIIKQSGDVVVGEPAPVKETLTKRIVTTGANAMATVQAGSGTTVTIEPRSVVELADGNTKSPWIGLTSGSMFAQVDRSDRPVVVGVHGEAMSLRPGCAAMMVTDNAGTQLTCKTGEVHIEWDQRQTRVLGPATCSVNPASGPALPYPAAASKEACSSIDTVDHLLQTAPPSPKMMYGELHDYLQATTAADATTLWNLLWRVPQEWREPVRDRLAKFIRQPKSDPQMVLRLDPMTMDAWWSAAVEASERR